MTKLIATLQDAKLSMEHQDYQGLYQGHGVRYERQQQDHLPCHLWTECSVFSLGVGDSMVIIIVISLIRDSRPNYNEISLSNGLTTGAPFYRSHIVFELLDLRDNSSVRVFKGYDLQQIKFVVERMGFKCIWRQS